LSNARLELEILPQPDDSSCGPTCLHAVYGYFSDPLPLSRVVDEVDRLEEGGTLSALLGCHALRRGYRAKIYTYNLKVFDPTWFALEKETDLAERLQLQMKHKKSRKLRVSSRGYLEFLSLGGEIVFEDLTAGLLRRYLKRGLPILTGLSATHLYRSPRELGAESIEIDDVRGRPAGHFVVLCGYDQRQRHVLVADPLREKPVSHEHKYWVGIDRLICAILLGVLTDDANLLILEPPLSEPAAHEAWTRG
jgi:Peptidase_C39 like family